jgi:hypothetical protein
MQNGAVRPVGSMAQTRCIMFSSTWAGTAKRLHRGSCEAMRRLQGALVVPDAAAVLPAQSLVPPQSWVAMERDVAERAAAGTCPAAALRRHLAPPRPSQPQTPGQPGAGGAPTAAEAGAPPLPPTAGPSGKVVLVV